jgi:thiol-disulfide isomerase/thioredoxin
MLVALKKPRSILLALLLLFTGFATAEEEPAPAPDKPAAEDNPYIPRDDLSTLELFELIERMKGLPKSLQGRPGFSDAIIVCADRILAASPDGTMRGYAMRAKMDGLQRGAIWNEAEGKREAAQKTLVELAQKCLNDQDKDVVHWAGFYLLEDKVIAADKLDPEKLSAVLDEVRTFTEEEKLDNRHVRLASATVKLINKLPSEEAADKAYKEFGRKFANSTDDELHRYGDRIAEGVPRRPADLTGKPIQIVGRLYDGGKFDSHQWKGKVVLVDFWATWCGPCRASLPELQAIHERFHAKGFDVIGVSLDESRDALEAFFEETPLPWPNILDAEADDAERMAKKYSIVGIPTTYLLDQDGNLAAMNLQGEKLAAKIEELLRTKKK